MQKSLITLSKLSTALAVAYASMSANAQIAPTNGKTKVTNQAGVAIVNIATPTASGLSHNQYQQFNVSKQGAVLNNARRAGRSELAGQLAANPHLKQRSATVILNEVVSRTPSTIAGQQEIFGQRADYVLANPNGISVQGGGFINTAKASLVVGKPTVKKGTLNGFDVNGEQTLTTADKLNGKLDQLDLIAPKVQIQGDISGSQNVNVIGGKNKITRQVNGKLDIQVQKAGGAVLDGKIAGSIQANRIRIHQTDSRATLELVGAKLTASDLGIAAENALLRGEFEKKATDSSRTYMEGKRVKYSAEKRVKAQETQSTQTQTLRKTHLKSDDLVLDVKNNLAIAAGDIQAKKALIRGGKATLGVQTTVDNTHSTLNRSKGSWYRNDSSKSMAQTRHQTSLNVDSLTLVANRDKLTAQAVKFEVKNALLFGEKGVELNGAIQQRKQTKESNYRNETASLKSGRNYVNLDEETLLTTDFNVAENLQIGSNGRVNFAAVKGQIDGNLLVESRDKTTFTAQSSRTKREIDDREKYWGGLAGSNSGSASVDEQTQHGTDFTVKGLAYLRAANGVQISGSRVLAGEGYVHSRGGALQIDSVNVQTTAKTSSRKGTIFDITQARQEDFSRVTTSQGATLQSKSNLSLITDRDINVVGSKVLAGGLLDFSANNINVSGAVNQRESHHAAYALGFSHQITKPTKQNHIESLVNEVIDTWLDGKRVEKPLALLSKHSTTSAGASVTLGVKSQRENVSETSVTASTLQGNAVTVSGQNFTLRGSHLRATGGDVQLNANRIATLAQKETVQTTTNQTNVGLTLSGKLTNKNVNASVSLGVEHSQHQTQTQTAQVSTIQAQGNVMLNADRIVHQGSQVSAGGNLVEQANHIRHETVETTQMDNRQSVNVGLGYELTVNQDKSQVHSVNLSASGKRENSLSTQHQSTQLSSGGDLVVRGQNVWDKATQYQAGQDVQITAADYAFSAVQNTQQQNSVNAGAKVGVSASTTDYKSATLAVNLGANYQQAHSVNETAQLGRIQAKNIAISANQLALQGNLAAENRVVLNAAQSLEMTQGTHHSQKASGGFEASVSVGGIATAGTVIPSVNVALSANGEKGQGQTAVMNGINANHIVIQAGQNANLQGVNMNAQRVDVTAQHVSIGAGHSASSLNKGSAGVSVGVGKNQSGVSASGKFSATVEKETAHTRAQLNAANVSITAQNGVTLNGVNTQAENVAIQGGNGGIVLNALQNYTHKTGVSAALALNGDVKDQQWNAKGGSAALAVNVVRNETHTASQIHANTAALNTAGDLVFNGSVMNAHHVSGNVAGNVVSTSATDKIRETAVALSASGSGKYSAYPEDKWGLSLKKDWDNGAIAGMKGEVNASVHVLRQQQGLATGVNAAENHLNVSGTTLAATTASAQHVSYDQQLNLTTNIKERYYLPWRKQQFGQ